MRRLLLCLIALASAAAIGLPAMASASTFVPAPVSTPLIHTPTTSGPTTTTSPGSSPTTAPNNPDAGLPASYQKYHSPLYDNPAHWLCLPGRTTDPCGVNLDATVVNADGTTSIQKHVANPNPPIDCFYVYPTASTEPTENSDLGPGKAEANVVENQAARLNSTCKVYAPEYRSRTLAGLFGTAKPNPPGRTEADAYSDVLDAFHQYVANFSHGRGFILVGHSQGAGILEQLIVNEIDDVPALRARMVGAILAGATVHVPKTGAVVGGTFKHVPLCTRSGQIGCVITFDSFRATAPLPSNSFFGQPSSVGPAACVNPAALGGGSGELIPYFSTTSLKPLTNPAAEAKITTRWVTLPDWVSARCATTALGIRYLSITIQAKPGGPRTNKLTGDITPPWGLHLDDLNITAGNLEADVAAMAKTYTGA